jgi:hypothetical protein
MRICALFSSVRASAVAACAAFAVAVLLGGCARGSLTQSADVAPPEGSALVILGLAYTGSPTGPLRNQCPFIGGIFEGMLGRENLEISALDSAGRQSMLDRYYVSKGVCSAMGADKAMHYNFLHLPEGRYGIFGFINQDGWRTLRFVNPASFEVKAQEVVYIGDFTLDSFSNAALARFERSVEGARAALAARNGPAEKMTVRIVSVPPSRPVSR